MAKKQDSYDRIRIFLKRNIKAIILGLNLTAIKGRIDGPRVLMTSIPKGGTNLLENALFNFPILRRKLGRTFQRFRSIDSKTFKILSNIHNGQFLVAHLAAFPEVIEYCKRNNIKVIFMIRDPRDIMVSHCKYVAGIDSTHVLYEYYNSLPSDDARLMATIKGEHEMQDSVKDVLGKYGGWLYDDNTLVVKFEDLIGSNGGGDDRMQYAVVKSIGIHLGIDMTDEKIQYICSSVFNSKAATFRSGQINGWVKYFKPEHIEVFNQLAGDLMTKYGYK